MLKRIASKFYANVNQASVDNSNVENNKSLSSSLKVRQLLLHFHS